VFVAGNGVGVEVAGKVGVGRGVPADGVKEANMSFSSGNVSEAVSSIPSPANKVLPVSLCQKNQPPPIHPPHRRTITTAVIGTNKRDNLSD
jgi:hypothetical protein